MNTDKVSAFGQEQEQQQEQEQEQEKEQQQQQQKEQEQEVEEPELPAKEKYTREDEYLKEWPLAALGAPPSKSRSWASTRRASLWCIARFLRSAARCIGRATFSSRLIIRTQGGALRRTIG